VAPHGGLFISIFLLMNYVPKLIFQNLFADDVKMFRIIKSAEDYRLLRSDITHKRGALKLHKN
jgi:hypothetical protein